MGSRSRKTLPLRLPGRLLFYPAVSDSNEHRQEQDEPTPCRPPLRYRDNTARQKRERGIEATVNGGKFRQDKVQHGENDQGGHCQNNDGIA